MGSKTFEVRTYDVWGNAGDGYEISDSFRIGSVEIPDDADFSEVWQRLLDAGLTRGKTSDGTIEWFDDSDAMIYAKADGYPVFWLRAEP